MSDLRAALEGWLNSRDEADWSGPPNWNAEDGYNAAVEEVRRLAALASPDSIDVETLAQAYLNVTKALMLESGVMTPDGWEAVAATSWDAAVRRRTRTIAAEYDRIQQEGAPRE